MCHTGLGSPAYSSQVSLCRRYAMRPTELCREERKETVQHLEIGTRMYVIFIKYTYEGMLKALHTTILIEKIHVGEDWSGQTCRLYLDSWWNKNVPLVVVLLQTDSDWSSACLLQPFGNKILIRVRVLGSEDTDIQKWKQVYYENTLSDATNSIFLIPSKIWEVKAWRKNTVSFIFQFSEVMSK